MGSNGSVVCFHYVNDASLSLPIRWTPQNSEQSLQSKLPPRLVQMRNWNFDFDARRGCMALCFGWVASWARTLGWEPDRVG